jgi:C4-type Zn-finger protein
MKSFDLHQILRQIHQKIQCPSCKKTMPLKNISLVKVSYNFCVYQAECDNCNKIAMVNAVLDKKEQDLDKITLNTINLLKKELNQLKSFKKILKK